MDDVFLILFFLSVVALVVGIIKPDIVIRWGDPEKRNRKNVVKYYGVAIVAFFILFGVSSSESEPNKAVDVEAEQENIEKVFEISDEDKNLLKGSYNDFTDEQVLRFSEIKDNYEGVDEDTKKEIKPDIDRLISERTSIEEAKRAEEAAKAEEEARVKAEKEAAEAEAKKKAEAEKYNTGLTRNDLARDKAGKLGSLVKFSGKIVQVMNGKGYTQYRMAVNGDYDQMILIEITNDKLDSNILEDDQITIEGVSIGNITYKTAIGGELTIPGVSVDNVYY